MTAVQRSARIALVVLYLVAAATLVLHGQSPSDLSELRAQLRARYDLVALQGGVGLVPRAGDGGIRLVEIRDGAVAIDGTPVTARELRDRVGRDADAILRITYLDLSAQRALTDAAPADAVIPAAATPNRDSDRSATPAPSGVERRSGRGDVVRIFSGHVTVPRDERIRGDVVVIGGSAQIDGEVTGDVSVIMGPLDLGTDAVVRGEVNVVGGPLRRAPGARIEGSVHEVAMRGIGRRRPWSLPGLMFSSFLARVGSLVGTVLRIALLLLIAFIVVAAGGQTTERIATRVGSEPVRSGLAGLLAQLLLVPLLVITVVILAISIVGIPLLVLVPFGVVLFLLTMVVGFTGVAYQVGAWLMSRFGWTERSAYGGVALGVLAITGVTLAARLGALVGGFLVGGPLGAAGYLIEYAAWTIGLGASILTWYSTRQPRVAAQTVSPTPSAS